MISSSEIKRQILMSAKDSPIKKKMDQPAGISEGEQIEMGNRLEDVTRMPGWIYIEAYMLRRMNLVGQVMSNDTKPEDKGFARAYIELMQWIQLSIERKNAILEKEKEVRVKHETKGIPEEETE